MPAPRQNLSENAAKQGARAAHLPFVAFSAPAVRRGGGCPWSASRAPAPAGWGKVGNSGDRAPASLRIGAAVDAPAPAQSAPWRNGKAFAVVSAPRAADTQQREYVATAQECLDRQLAVKAIMIDARQAKLGATIAHAPGVGDGDGAAYGRELVAIDAAAEFAVAEYRALAGLALALAQEIRAGQFAPPPPLDCGEAIARACGWSLRQFAAAQLAFAAAQAKQDAWHASLVAKFGPSAELREKAEFTRCKAHLAYCKAGAQSAIADYWRGRDQDRARTLASNVGHQLAVASEAKPTGQDRHVAGAHRMVDASRLRQATCADRELPQAARELRANVACRATANSQTARQAGAPFTGDRREPRKPIIRAKGWADKLDPKGA